MFINERLKELNKLFQENNATLYVVGGFVRDSLLNIENADVDLASTLKIEEVEQILKNTDYIINNKNLSFGTAKIRVDNQIFEYSTFRKEFYKIKGKHCPSKIEFVNDIRIDASRRDFTCNALYYNLETNEIIDFFNGILHIKNKILVMINNNTFNNDGVRILRLFRFAKKLNFIIEKNTLNNAIKNVRNLKQISFERKLKEIEFLFNNKKERINFLENLENGQICDNIF